MHKNLLIFTFGFLFLSLTSLAQDKKRVLFLGNSYTAGLPPMIEQMAISAGDTLEFMESTGGGQRLSDHFQNQSTLDEIENMNWDYVVLQEQSQLPSFPESKVVKECYPFAKSLCDQIKKNNSCKMPMFYMTWGRKNGDQSNCQFFTPLCTYEGMDSMLRMRYEYMAEVNKAEISPVGAVWREVIKEHPSYELYSPDESHPSQIGMYASACCFYASIFRNDPMNITDVQGIDSIMALNIRKIAKKIVFDSLERWNIGSYDLKADFSFKSKSQFIFEFIDDSKNSTGQVWDINGTKDTSKNLEFTFPEGGVKKVTLKVFNECDTVEIEKEITVFYLSVDGIKIKEFIIEPNPAQSYIKIFPPTTVLPQFLEVLDIQGRVVLSKEVKKGAAMIILDVNILPKGSYSILLKTNSEVFHERLFKE